MIAKYLYSNPRLTAMLLAMILVAGLGALGSLPRQEDPTLTARFASVTTTFAGAGAERVERLVTERVEKAVREVAEVAEVTSTSRVGRSIVAIELWDDVTAARVDEVWSRVRDKLADVERELPAGAGRPEFEKGNVSAHTLMVGLTWRHDGQAQVDILHRLAKDLAQALRNLAGTHEVEVYGEPEEEIRVVIDPASLASSGLTVQAVAAAIGRADARSPAGQLRSEGGNLLLEVDDTLASIAQIRGVPLRQFDDGRSLRVGDVATVARAPKAPAGSIALIDGRQGLVVAAIMQPAERVDRWADGARRVAEDFAAALPPGIRAEILFDQSVYTDQRLGGLAVNLALGIGIIVAVLLVMMGWRSALLVAVSLPLAITLVLTMFNLLGVPLHQISITGLIIALGLLIDNAIISVDEYGRRRDAGCAPLAAIGETVAHLRLPLGASTLTTALTFMPIMLLPGPTGEFVGAMGLAVVLSIAASLLLALTVIPVLAAYLGRAGNWHGGYASRPLRSLYEGILGWLLARPARAIGLATVLPIAGFLTATQLVEQFFPPVDRAQFQIQVKLPAYTPIEKTRAAVARVRAVLDGYDGILRNHWFIGENPPRVFYNTLTSGDGVTGFASAFVDTVSAQATADLLPELQAALSRAVPQAVVLALPFEQGPPFEAPVELRVYGPEIHVLNRIGEDLRRVLSAAVNVTYTQAKMAGGQPKIALAPKTDELRLSGFRLADLSGRVGDRQEGVSGARLLEAGEELPIRVQLAAREGGSLATLATELLIADGVDAPSADRLPGVPLSALATLTLVPDVDSITRRQGERYNAVQGYLLPFSLPGETVADFERKLTAEGVELPPGYRIEYGGESSERAGAQSRLLAYLLPLMALMIVTVVMTFNSFLKGGVVALVAMLSSGLAFLSLWVTGYPMGFMAIMGTMGLIGLAINDSIVVLAALNADAEARRGSIAAVRRVVVEGTRHILSTTLTTIGGFLPLIVFGDRFWRPLATAVSGGVLGATLLALVLVPALFLLITRVGLVRAARREAAALRVGPAAVEAS